MNAPWVDFVVKLTPAFVTLVVGAVASTIAFLQFRISRDKLRLDLFSRRLSAYEKLYEYFACVLRDGSVDDATLSVLWDARHNSRFLFGPEIEAYLEDLTKKAVHVQALGWKLDGPGALPIGNERSQISEERTALVIWHMDEMKRASDRFARYIKFA